MRYAGVPVAALLLLAPTPAAADPVYFHKAQVSREAFEADLAECVGLAGGVRVQPQTAVYTPNLYAVAVTAFLSGFMSAREKRHMIKNVLRTCMTDKGYRRVKAPDEVSGELKRMKNDAERADRLFALASAAEPAGKVLPQ